MKPTEVTNPFKDGKSREFDKEGKLLKVDGIPIAQTTAPSPHEGEGGGEGAASEAADKVSSDQTDQTQAVKKGGK